MNPVLRTLTVKEINSHEKKQGARRDATAPTTKHILKLSLITNFKT
jgi:hypothetical protein